MLATVVMAGFGFVFWLIVARMFSTTNIGLATTLISVMNMIAMLSLVGFDAAFVRFLPRSDSKSDNINTGLIVVATVAASFSTIFIIFLNELSPSLDFIKDNIFTSAAFVFFCVMTALNILIDSVFLSERKAKYTLLINTVFSSVRLLLPFAFVGWGSLGIFGAVALSQTIGFALSLVIMIRHFGYRPEWKVSMDVLSRVRGYSLANYGAGILNLLPPTVLPILITNNLGPEQAAFYYIIMMIGNLMYTIPWASTKSLFAEGSHAEHSLKENSIRTGKFITALLLPIMLALYFFGDIILLVFGKTYSEEGFEFLRLIALSGIPVSCYSLLNSYFKVTKHPQWIIVMNLFYAVGILGVSYLLFPLGLSGIGYAWIFGNTLASVVGGAIIFLF